MKYLVYTFLSIFMFQPSTQSFSQEAKPENIIMLVVPGLGYGHLAVMNESTKGNAGIFKMNVNGIVRTSPEVIRSSVSASIISTGFLSAGKSFGIDAKGNKIKTLLELAAENKKATGIVSSASITDPLNAVFFAHQSSPDKTEAITSELFDLKPSIVVAGGSKYFKNRADNRDLLIEFRKEGYKIQDDKKDLEKGSQLKTIVLLAQENLEKAPLRGDFYEKAFQKAFKTLIKNDKGYFLLITFPQLEWACRENNSDYLSTELADLNKLIEKILLFAKNDDKTLFVIVSEKETGGVTLINDHKTNIRFADKNATLMPVPVFANGPGENYFLSSFSVNDIYYKIGNLLMK